MPTLFIDNGEAGSWLRAMPYLAGFDHVTQTVNTTGGDTSERLKPVAVAVSSHANPSEPKGNHNHAR